jgi:serine/threonine-protein kinase
VILYELLSGRRPHDGDSFLQILHRILTEPPLPLAQICPGLPAPVYEIVAKAMAMDPSQRIRGVRELADALEPFHGGALPPRPMPSSNPTRPETAGVPVQGAAAQSVVGVAHAAVTPKRGRSAALAYGAAASVALVGVGGWLTYQARRATLTAPSATLLSASSDAGPPPEPTRASPETLALPPEPARDDVRAHADAGSDAGAVGGDAGARRKAAPVKEPCKLTHYVDRDGNMHFSTDCPPTTK